MLFEKNRRRRVIYIDDSDQQYVYEGYPYEVTDEQSFLGARTTPTFNTHVDTYAWCVGNGATPPWEAQNTGLAPGLGSEENATDIIVEACHAQNVAGWGGLYVMELIPAGICGAIPALGIADVMTRVLQPSPAAKPRRLHTVREGSAPDRVLSAEHGGLPVLRETLATGAGGAEQRELSHCRLHP